MQLDPTNKTVLQTLQSFLKSYFSSLRSTEAMVRGTANRSAVFAAVSAKDFVLCLCECCIMAMRENGWLSISPDGVGIIDNNNLNFNQGNAQGHPVDYCCGKFS